MLLNRLDQRRVTVFDTQKLCVRLRSVATVLRGGGDRRDHLTFAAIEPAGCKHDLLEEGEELRADARVSDGQARHGRHEAEVVRVSRARCDASGPHGGEGFVAGHADPCF